MIERKKSYVSCPKCGNEAFKIHDPEKVKKDYPDIAIQTMMLRQYQCSNKQCSYVWEISFMDTLKAFERMRKEGGKNIDDVKNELQKVTERRG